MKHVTHKSLVKRVSVVLVAVAAAMAISFSWAVQAQDMPTSAAAKSAVTCLVLARAQDLPASVSKLFLQRIGKAKYELGTAYWMGYATGMLDAYGFANSKKFESMELARLDAATHLYKMLGCTINESI